TANRSSGPRQPIPSSKSCIDFARESAEQDTSCEPFEFVSIQTSEQIARGGTYPLCRHQREPRRPSDLCRFLESLFRRARHIQTTQEINDHRTT
ncbi:hypothetical protein, partial [Burkholderia pyrrocinia]|uniref:hypothetical protein n=1 Tax=Burkholderia pyrrocinia TaxID=60550 RepID=UPI001ABB3983